MVTGDALIFTLSDLTLNGMEGTSTVTISGWSEPDCLAEEGCETEILVDTWRTGWVDRLSVRPVMKR